VGSPPILQRHETSAACASACREAAQIVSTSRGESRASGFSNVHGPGILPLDASSQEAASKARCSFGEYVPHSEKLTAFRPSATPRAINQEKGATCVYHGHTVVFE